MMRPIPVLTALALLAATAALPISATQAPSASASQGAQAPDVPRLVPIADNVYAYVDLHPSGEITTVSLFAVGRDGVLLADGQSNPDATRRLLDTIQKTAGKPVKWYVVGSDHGDHTGGNAVLPRDVTWIVHPTSRAQLERSAASAKAARAKQDAGASAAAAAREIRVPPAAMSGDREVVDLGTMQVHILFLGRAHTGGDLMVYLPAQKILFMSEAFLNRVFPAMRSGYPSEWVKTIDRALTLDVETFVPGHGPIERGETSRRRLIEFQDALEYVIAEVRTLHDRKLSPEDARAQANWGPYAAWSLAGSQDIIAIRRVYDEIEGRLK